MHSLQLTAVPAPVAGLMADSEQDETFEDAEDSGDEQQRIKSRKTASGRVLIHSKWRAPPSPTSSPPMPCCWAATSSTAPCCSSS
eukprot:4698183-Prymnesium_polylepis.1